MKLKTNKRAKVWKQWDNVKVINQGKWIYGKTMCQSIAHWWVKKQVMKYHWSKDTLFFQNLVVLRHVERRMLIEKIHEEIGHFGEM